VNKKWLIVFTNHLPKFEDQLQQDINDTSMKDMMNSNIKSRYDEATDNQELLNTLRVLFKYNVNTIFMAQPDTMEQCAENVLTHQQIELMFTKYEDMMLERGLNDRNRVPMETYY